MAPQRKCAPRRLASPTLRALSLNHPLFPSSAHRLPIPRRGPDRALQAKDPPSRNQTELQATACWLVSCACWEPAKATGVELVLLQRTTVADEHVECQLLVRRVILGIPLQESLGATAVPSQR